jgi:tRNA(Ile)-lysidine synthase
MARAEQLARFQRDLERLAGPPAQFGVAVSGGPDSLALLLLAHGAWPGGVHAATVDHGLRPEAGAEVAAVAALCSSLHVPHSTLRVQVTASGEGLQAAARAARYDVLLGWMEEANLPLLLTAHHGDDQAETLLMRLLRGSGVAGLAGVRPLRPLAPGRLLCRPLLGWRREELAQIVDEAGVVPTDDPSNASERHDRVRLRHRLAETPWLEAPPLARSAAALAEAEEALEMAADRFEEERVLIGDVVVLDPSSLPRELLRRLALRCLRQIEPEAAPRGEELSRLIDSLAAGETATLAGVKATGGATWRFERARPRRPVRRRPADV